MALRIVLQETSAISAAVAILSSRRGYAVVDPACAGAAGELGDVMLVGSGNAGVQRHSPIQWDREGPSRLTIEQKKAGAGRSLPATIWAHFAHPGLA